MTHDSANGDYPTALQALWQRSAYDRGFISNPFAGDDAADLGLRRTAALLHRLGRPQDRYGVVHVAGSKGKGSTTVFIASILQAAGFRVGRYTQPHLHSIRERIAVDDEPIAESAFAALTQRGLNAVREVERDAPELGEMTAFEVTTAMALAHFADAGCDLAVVEVGLGGTLDATNVVSPLVSVITTLDLEHTAVLGNTLPEIAAQKAGIIKRGRPVAVSLQPADALAVIARTAADCGAPLIAGGRDWRWSGSWQSFTAEGPWGTCPDLTSGLAGAHQVENACTAIAATWLLRTDGDTIDEAAVRTGLSRARWPGRFEVVRDRGPRIILDGAHTPASARALAGAVQDDDSAPAVIVLGLLGDKDAHTVGEMLMPVASKFIVTAPHSPRAAAPESVAESLKDSVDIEIVMDVAMALSRAEALAGATGTVVVTGSLSTVAEAREALGLGRPDPKFGA